MQSKVAVNAQEMPILKVKDLAVSRSGKVVIKEIDLEVHKGEFVGIVGPNGSGKSTLLLAILGILKSQKGSIDIYGQQPMSRKVIGKIGWVSQAAANLPRDIRITVRELVNLGTVNAKNMYTFTDTTTTFNSLSISTFDIVSVFFNIF